MASLIWSCVYLLLKLELAFILILVAPVPRKTRNFICREVNKFDLKDRLYMPLLIVGLFLAFILLDCYSNLEFILDVEKEAGEHHNGLDKEKEYRAERNIYLAGFALTLLFAICRLTELMQEHVELEDECDQIKRDKTIMQSVLHDSGRMNIEMTTLKK